MQYLELLVTFPICFSYIYLICGIINPSMIYLHLATSPTTPYHDYDLASTLSYEWVRELCLLFNVNVFTLQ